MIVGDGHVADKKGAVMFRSKHHNNPVGRLRQFAHLVFEESVLAGPPVISGLLDIENEFRWRKRP